MNFVIIKHFFVGFLVLIRFLSRDTESVRIRLLKYLLIPIQHVSMIPIHHISMIRIEYIAACITLNQ